MLIRTIGSYTPERVQNLNTKGETKSIVVAQACYLKSVSVERYRDWACRRRQTANSKNETFAVCLELSVQ